MVAWELLTWVGTVAFAMSGSISAMEEEYDILGVYALGLVTAFGGGIVRNMLIDADASAYALWQQGDLLLIALTASSIVYFVPRLWANYAKTWVFFDAIGLAAFAIQGALVAAEKQLPLPAIVVAALLTGCGGGVIRDILARRKPLVFREEVYGVWAMLAGLAVAMGFGRGGAEMYALFAALLALRMLSVRLRWRLPKRSFRAAPGASGFAGPADATIPADR
ncbi:trimeric intracellular cation channel family protein [Paenibacillus sp.]|uniref:trimeric intracellular cation channel family protein n=1 Tax=Paenibacillus sp. TaxID=58172 RepID=UPI002D6AFC5E|nr:trimeric intracellular cation channel family protein [Paenibacillus sp.]HZG55310.1 trimeric intracellular cation channel family protein [Paenibacillus sp.]